MIFKNKLILLIIPIALLSCGGGKNATCILDKNSPYSVKADTEGYFVYKCVDFNFYITDGKNKTITKDNFYAVVDGTRVNPVCMFSSVTWHNYDPVYNSIVESKELKAGTTTYLTPSYAFIGFDLNSGLSKSSKYYVNNVEVNFNSEVNVKL